MESAVHLISDLHSLLSLILLPNMKSTHSSIKHFVLRQNNLGRESSKKVFRKKIVKE